MFCFLYNQLPFWDKENEGNEFAIITYIFENDVPKQIEASERKIVSDEKYEEIIKA